MGQGLSRQDRALRRAVDSNSTESIRQVRAIPCSCVGGWSLVVGAWFEKHKYNRSTLA